MPEQDNDAGTRGVDEGRLFESLCEMTDGARLRELARLDAEAPALAARLRRLLAIDDAYGAHTARSVMPHELPDPVDGINDIGPFRLLRQIGRGGMGVVYLAERRSGFAQQVALKIMPRFAGDEAGRARFARERAILAQLRQPNICTILDGGELHDGTPWLAMEYVPGETLCAWSAARRLDLRARVALFLQLCDAVQYAHRNLVVHRDLKDSNVLVDEAGHLKLLDFGIARSLAPNADGHTLAQDAFFSPMTAAPEQIRGERVSVGADVYALGALLHQLLTGTLPFETRRLPPLELQHAILDAVPPRMSDVVEHAAAASTRTPAQVLRGDLDAIVAHCLRKDPSERYAGVGELAHDLRAWQSGHPISIAHGDRAYRMRKFLRRHRVTAALTAVIASGVLIALAVTLWQATELRRQRDAADVARRHSEIDRDRARAVAAFVRNTFEQADPGKASEDTLMARDLIARGKRRLGELDGQPQVQADLALLMAENEAGLGRLHEAAATYAAHAKQIDALSRTDDDVHWRAQSLQLWLRRELQPDTPDLDARLSALARLADTPDRLVRIARERERLHARRAEFGKAARTLEDAWRTLGPRLSANEALRLRIDLGNALHGAERYEDALDVAQGIDRKTLSQRNPDLQIRAWQLIVHELDKNGAARDSLVQAVAAWRATAERFYGADSLEAASAYVWSVGVSDDPQAQSALMQRAYAIQTAKLPPVSMARAYVEFNMGSYFLTLRDAPAQAEPHVARAVALGRQAASRAHGDVRMFELRWARTLNALGRHATCLAELASPPGNPEEKGDAKSLSGLHLELAAAAIALGHPAQAGESMSAAAAVWAERGETLPQAQQALHAKLQREFARRSDRHGHGSHSAHADAHRRDPDRSRPTVGSP